LVQSELVDGGTERLALGQRAIVRGVGCVGFGQLDAAQLNADDEPVPCQRLHERDPGQPATEAAGEEDHWGAFAHELVNEWCRSRTVDIGHVALPW
jgi:hypothetical protein